MHFSFFSGVCYEDLPDGAFQHRPIVGDGQSCCDQFDPRPPNESQGGGGNASDTQTRVEVVQCAQNDLIADIDRRCVRLDVPEALRQMDSDLRSKQFCKRPDILQNESIWVPQSPCDSLQGLNQTLQERSFIVDDSLMPHLLHKPVKGTFEATRTSRRDPPRAGHSLEIPINRAQCLVDGQEGQRVKQGEGCEQLTNPTNSAVNLVKNQHCSHFSFHLQSTNVMESIDKDLPFDVPTNFPPPPVRKKLPSLFSRTSSKFGRKGSSSYGPRRFFKSKDTSKVFAASPCQPHVKRDGITVKKSKDQMKTPKLDKKLPDLESEGKAGDHRKASKPIPENCTPLNGFQLLKSEHYNNFKPRLSATCVRYQNDSNNTIESKSLHQDAQFNLTPLRNEHISNTEDALKKCEAKISEPFSNTIPSPVFLRKTENRNRPLKSKSFYDDGNQTTNCFDVSGPLNACITLRSTNSEISNRKLERQSLFAESVLAYHNQPTTNYSPIHVTTAASCTSDSEPTIDFSSQRQISYCHNSKLCSNSCAFSSVVNISPQRKLNFPTTFTVMTDIPSTASDQPSSDAPTVPKPNCIATIEDADRRSLGLFSDVSMIPPLSPPKTFAGSSESSFTFDESSSLKSPATPAHQIDSSPIAPLTPGSLVSSAADFVPSSFASTNPPPAGVVLSSTLASSTPASSTPESSTSPTKLTAGHSSPNFTLPPQGLHADSSAVATVVTVSANALLFVFVTKLRDELVGYREKQPHSLTAKSRME